MVETTSNECHTTQLVQCSESLCIEKEIQRGEMITFYCVPSSVVTLCEMGLRAKSTAQES